MGGETGEKDLAPVADTVELGGAVPDPGVANVEPAGAVAETSRPGATTSEPVVPGAKIGVPVEEHILIADDEPMLTRAAKRMMERAFSGTNFDTAGDGAEALATAQSLRAGLNNHLLLVLSDTMMPRMTGIELYEELRKIPGLEDLPFILMSGHVSDGVREMLDKVLASEDLFFRFMDKPFPREALISLAKELIALRAERRAAMAEVADRLTADAPTKVVPASEEPVPADKSALPKGAPYALGVPDAVGSGE